MPAGADALANLDLLADQLLKVNINGIALSRAFANTLRKLRVTATGARRFPEIPLSLNAGTIDGIPASTSTTVEGEYATTPTNALAFMGDFTTIRWRLVRPITAEVIPYGDPDNTGIDLAGSNQVAYRSEACSPTRSSTRRRSRCSRPPRQAAPRRSPNDPGAARSVRHLRGR